jgi:hypothetical protein
LDTIKVSVSITYGYGHAFGPGIACHALERVAGSMSDTEAAQRVQLAKDKLFEQIQRSA